MDRTQYKYPDSNVSNVNKIFRMNGAIETTMRFRKIIFLVIFTLVMSLVYHFAFNDTVSKISGGSKYIDSLHFSIIAMWGLVGEQFNVESRTARFVILAQTSISMLVMAFI